LQTAKKRRSGNPDQVRDNDGSNIIGQAIVNKYSPILYRETAPVNTAAYGSEPMPGSVSDNHPPGPKRLICTEMDLVAPPKADVPSQG
jgi:hypothetical protein